MLLSLLMVFLVLGVMYVHLAGSFDKGTVEGIATDSGIAPLDNVVQSTSGANPASSSAATNSGQNSMEQDLATLEQLNIKSELDRPEVYKITMQGVAGILEVSVEATGEGVLSKTGRADRVMVQLGSPGKTNQVIITPRQNGLTMTANNVAALISTSLTFSKTTNQLLIEDLTGPRFIRILPDQALVIARTAMDGELVKMELMAVPKSGVGDDLIYKVTGKKQGKLLGIFPVEITSEITVGVQSGLVTGVNEPFWLKFVSGLII